jgi:hypothetical protein
MDQHPASPNCGASERFSWRHRSSIGAFGHETLRDELTDHDLHAR